MTCKFLPLINDLVFVRVCRRSRRGLRLFLASFSASDDAVIAYADEYEWEEDEWDLMKTRTMMTTMTGGVDDCAIER